MAQRAGIIMHWHRLMARCAKSRRPPDLLSVAVEGAAGGVDLHVVEAQTAVRAGDLRLNTRPAFPQASE